MIVFSGLILEINMIAEAITMIWTQSIKIVLLFQASLEVLIQSYESLEVLMEDNM